MPKKITAKKAPKAKRASAGSGKWIADAIERPGSLHRELGIPEGKKIPQSKLKKAAKAKGKLGKRARLAETLEGFKKKKK